MFRTLLIAVVFATVGNQLFAAEPPSMKESDDARLEFMQQSGAAYEVKDASGDPIKFIERPVLRWTNPVSGVHDGGLFFWANREGRPVAAAQVFLIPKSERLWLHEFQSLGTAPMTFSHNGRKAWTPNKPGIEFKPIANDVAPRASTAMRLLQMRRIAQRFSVGDDFEGTSEYQLELMSKPLYRYKTENVVDGAVFVFAHGTDPELFVLIEARKGDEEQPQWYVALAPMTSYALEARLDEKPYWSVPHREAPHPITATFRNFLYPPTN
ncbi:hypothetical protein LOC67_22050 [Stieleria sp. JC731]|uniref:hypothetical protein n=1 Tax=Pirellulaceae TaxID=2691357 RepID=UPI001E4125D3|nr:hypothetical protein [Stieleria sp. JC731]MCC9603241.1 hypothetical protein [Stieleria sp. JC731]